jgi:hypothetical protein
LSGKRGVGERGRKAGAEMEITIEIENDTEQR